MQVEKTQQAVKKEQGLASKLKEEIKAVNSSAEEQMQLEQQKVQATEKERSLTEKALQAERQKVQHMQLQSALSCSGVPCTAFASTQIRPVMCWHNHFRPLPCPVFCGTLPLPARLTVCIVFALGHAHKQSFVLIAYQHHCSSHQNVCRAAAHSV